MINVKLFVLFVLFEINESGQNYCEICPGHTLCLYKNPGPSPSCKSYDKAASLTKDDVRTILDKINQRRNFVALGKAKNVPSAANMNKLVWSNELAKFAQRWVDQCDVAIRPASKDICRDLADTYVGQNIATVIGFSPGLKVMSFVEMWFMESLYYNGSVTYFNQSEESKTNHFTQLIWADTKYVGCGKARFSIDDRGTIIDRLVCNFAPRGNFLGKPIYTIGYPATQCNGNSRRDETFSGLCKFQIVTTLNTTSTAAVSSLLRIVNLPNESVNDINILRKDYEHLETNNDVTNLVRHQKMRHITNNSLYVQHELEPNPITHEATNIPARHNIIPFQHTISHFQNFHGAVYKTRPPKDDFKRHDNMDKVVNPYSLNDQEFRKHYISRECTRKSSFDNTSHRNYQNENDQCTRRLPGNHQIITTLPLCCPQNSITKITTISPICECNPQKTTCHPSTTQFTCNLNNCCCLNANNYATVNYRRIPGELASYDNIPDINVHIGDEINKRQLLKYFSGSTHSTPFPTPIANYEEDSNAEYFTAKTKTFYFNKRKAQRQYNVRRNSQKKQTYFHRLINPLGRQKRLKRQFLNPSLSKAFWQSDDYEVQAQLKSLRYTTLPSHQRRKFRTNQRMRYDTESITIKLKDVSSPEFGHRSSTEKFLSFDELMHLRRDYGKEGSYNYNARRTAKKGKDSTTKKATTKKTDNKNTKKDENTKITTKAAAKKSDKPTSASSATAATKIPTTIATVPSITTALYKPLKHCSRKVTCTWTAPTVTGKDGKVFTKGRGTGSRTPPGYVEGCSRTSTCTREYMNRNKQPTAADDTQGATVPEEDYCERRSLDLEPRDSEDAALGKAVDQAKISSENPMKYTSSLKYESLTTNQEDCPCDNQENRKKRCIGLKRPKSQEGKSVEGPITYNDLYFVILSKILRMLGNNKISNKSNECQCNESNNIHLHNLNYLLMFLLLYTY